MVAIARSAGAPANFAGSGGAVVGCCEDEGVFLRLQEAFARAGIAVVRPQVQPAGRRAPVGIPNRG